MLARRADATNTFSIEGFSIRNLSLIANEEDHDTLKTQNLKLKAVGCIWYVGLRNFPFSVLELKKLQVAVDEVTHFCFHWMVMISSSQTISGPHLCCPLCLRWWCFVAFQGFIDAHRAVQWSSDVIGWQLQIFLNIICRVVFLLATPLPLISFSEMFLTLSRPFSDFTQVYMSVLVMEASVVQISEIEKFWSIPSRTVITCVASMP